MYKRPGDQVNAEDYLMGKEVDKAFMDAQDGRKDAAGVRAVRSQRTGTQVEIVCVAYFMHGNGPW